MIHILEWEIRGLNVGQRLRAARGGVNSSCNGVKKESSFGFFLVGRNPTSGHPIQTLNPREECTAVAQLFEILRFYFVRGSAHMWLSYL